MSTLWTLTLLADRRNMMYMGTTVSSGRAVGLVVETGMKTQLGRIASDISEAKTPKTPLELKLESLGRFLGFIALIVAVLLVSIKLVLAWGGSEPLRDVASAIHYCDCDFRSDCARRIADYSCYYIGFRHAEHGKAQGHYSQNESS